MRSGCSCCRTGRAEKTTLLRALARMLIPRAGAVYLDGRVISSYGSAEVARQMAVLPQRPEAPQTLTVAELVEHGNYPHAGALRMLRRQGGTAATT